MRRAIRIVGLLSLFFFTLSSLTANPIVHGYFIEKLPAKLGVKPLNNGKSLVLAQILNTNHSAFKAGAYEIGVEVKTNGRSKKYALKPNKSIQRNALTTFRMAIPVSETDKKSGSFRIFAKTAKETIWSTPSTFLQGVRKSKDGITTLYTEAPPERIIPPQEVPFENNTKAPKATVMNQKAARVTPKKMKIHKSPLKVAPTPEKIVSRKINSSEFKKLRTIDEELVIYIIKKGDSLKSIAQKYYGNSNKEKTIANLNFIENPSSIKVGEEIIVAVRPLEETTTKPSKKSKTNSVICKTTYTIHAGDTLGKIAQKLLGSSSKANKILEVNPDIRPDRLRIGTKINIPECKGGNA